MDDLASSMPGAEPLNWTRVIDLAGETLHTSTGKPFRIASVNDGGLTVVPESTGNPRAVQRTELEHAYALDPTGLGLTPSVVRQEGASEANPAYVVAILKGLSRAAESAPSPAAHISQAPATLALPSEAAAASVTGIGRIQRVPLREVWKHEALDFTRWLQENTDVLNNLTGLSLQNVEREQAAGAFNVDLVGEDASGATVIIENQLEKSDHDHLGKLITYVNALEAKVAVWIVAEPRPEHVGAINWLNGSSSAAFYLLKVEAIQIDGSRPAPLLTLITGPSETTSRASETKRELAGRHVSRHEFWKQLLEIVKKRTRLHANISPGHDYWIGTGAGKSGLAYNYVIRQKSCSVELYIDRGDEVINKSIFDRLYQMKERIESGYGQALKWERLDGKRACRISGQLSVGGLNDEDCWPNIQEAMVDAMIRFESSLRAHIADLQ